ncbi:hypothetical protein TRFO_18679 [Tritrichomonas foetus]|uniref:HECT-type E3 ubiquitin transferase n=1 Tax=Tritrichomonas foetus TaxID=1144522 RepID=A0A1J4KLG6_9EUKA|nr:hypothetical protein TRFO_18679 [Tritrichomonas foetus]|eukprot:OHT11784.1 hypothetical protein TRFO_18679 [Tritrichomonas foetus]
MNFSFPSDPMNRYNAPSYRAILKGLQTQGPSQVEVLQILSEMLIFANDSLLSEFPLNDVCKSLTLIASTSQSEEVLLLCSQCIYSLLEAHQSATKTMMRLRLVQILTARMQSVKSIATIENILHVLSFFATTSPEIFGEILGIQIFLNAFPNISKIEQRSCISTVATITERYVSEKFGESLITIVSIINYPDNLIRQQANSAFASITASISPQSIPKTIYLPMIETLYTTTDLNVALNFSKILYRAVKDHSGLRILLSQIPDFEKLLFSPCAKENKDFCQQLLDISQHMLPPPNLPRHLWTIKNRVYPTSHEFVAHLEPILLKFLSERPDCEQSAIMTLSGCASIIPIKTTPELLNILLRLAKSSRRAPYVLSIALNATSKTDVLRSGLIEILKGTSVGMNHKEWYKERIKTFSSTTGNVQTTSSLPASIAFSQTLDTILEYIKSENIMPYEFLHTNLIDKCATIIRAGVVGNTDISILVKLAYGILDFQPFPKVHDAFRVTNVSHFTKKTIVVNLSSPRGIVKDFNVSLMWDFMALEGWYNLEYNSKTVTRLFDALHSKSPLQRMIEKQKENHITDDPIRFALLCRGFRVEKYVHCSFKCRNYIFSAYDQISHALALLCPTPESLAQGHLDFTLLEKEAPRSDFHVPNFESDDMKKALDFLFLIYTKLPSKFYLNQNFSHQTLTRMSSPLLTMFHYDPAVRLMYKHPFLFPFKDRKFIFRVIALDPNIGIKELRERLFPGSERGQISQLHLHCTVDRARLLDEGSFLIVRLGGGRFLTEFNFLNEIGFGDGPTQEFFALLSRFYCLKELKMWRDDFNYENEKDSNNKYSWTDGGLFPQPSVDGSLLEELGILCSKALIMEKIIDIPFNPAFFKLIMGLQVNLSEVDPMLARSLTYKEGLYGLTFVYPGEKPIELKPNGANITVNETNVNEYIMLVTDFTCGKRMFERVKPFINGFERNIPRGALRIFSPEEITKMVSGEDVKITMQDLRDSVKLEHGYSNGSPEIEMLFNIILEMSDKEKKLLTKFITGCERLPVGGLASLEPKLTIAKRISDTSDKPDNCLPSVMTCTNYFKMPPYSNPEIMKKKIIQAIYECQDTFQLS